MLERILGRFVIAAVCASSAVRAHPSAARGSSAPQEPSASDAGVDVVELRVLSARLRAATVDRGSADGLALQDRVEFRTRDGRMVAGTVIELQERTAIVAPDDPAFVPAPGVRGTVRVPRARREPQPAPEPAPTPAPDAPGAPSAPGATQQPGAPQSLPWRNADQDWTPDQPLLARVRAVRPSERASRIVGRWYAIGDVLGSSEDSRSDAFVRIGAGAEYENPFGDGGVLHVDGEVNWRNTDVPDADDENETRARLDRFSYTWGGTRFESRRVEIGRFLQHDVPELGVLDGLQWTQSLAGASRIGASVGFLPEPDAEQSPLHDLQVAGYWHWAADETETVSATAAYQKTFHDLAADRDLVVGRLEILPANGWSFRATTWIDWYGTTDVAKGTGFEVTQAYVTTGRRWSDGSSLDLVYSHVAFPDLDRHEFTPVLDAQLADDHSERLSLRGRKRLSRDWTFAAELGGWTDQDDQGGDGELGVEIDDALVEHGVLALSGFAQNGRFTSSVGGRCSYGRVLESSAWHVEYEFARNLIEGFGSDNNELPEHRLRAAYDWYRASGWSVSTHVEGRIWDQETAFALGFYLQRNF